MPDEVAMVSRNADGSDAQPNGTERILSPEAAKEADEVQLAFIHEDQPVIHDEPVHDDHKPAHKADRK